MASATALLLPNQRTTAPRESASKSSRASGAVRAELRGIERAFGQTFSLLDLHTGELTHAAADWLNCDLYSRLSIGEEIARRGQPEVLDEYAPLLMLAIPIRGDAESISLLAISTFLTQPIETLEQISAAAHAFGVDAEQAFRWCSSRTAWHAHALLQLSTALAANSSQRQQIANLKAQLSDVSSDFFRTFDELSLLHRLSEQLSIAHSAAELMELAVRGLAEVVPAQCVVARIIDPSICQKDLGSHSTSEELILRKGTCPIPQPELATFVYRLGPAAENEFLVLNRDTTDSPTWCYPDVHQMISVPIRSSGRLLGHLLAINCRALPVGSEPEFRDVDASLLASVAAILGIHAGNLTLYCEQADFFASVVRALSSAIDAKDPYTCGHSERVARISVCLARQLDCTVEEIDTIYLSGLLHDIGKIGISDNVLRKPGPLTAAEYEHIKLHPELGYQILAGVKQLDQVLPVVLHHHETWDGQGYPHALKAEETPRLARIVAVADSVDAMASDRPYRQGIPDDKLDQAICEGSGSQWDPEVVEAFFVVREEVREIYHEIQPAAPLEIPGLSSQELCELHVRR